MIEGSNSVTVPPVDFDIVAIPDMSVQRAYRVVAVPLIMVVSENGKVEWVHYGTLSDAATNELLSVIDANSNSKARQTVMLTRSFILLSVLTLVPHPQETPTTAKRTRPDQQQIASAQKNDVRQFESRTARFKAIVAVSKGVLSVK